MLPVRNGRQVSFLFEDMSLRRLLTTTVASADALDVLDVQTGYRSRITPTSRSYYDPSGKKVTRAEYLDGSPPRMSAQATCREVKKELEDAKEDLRKANRNYFIGLAGAAFAAGSSGPLGAAGGVFTVVALAADRADAQEEVDDLRRTYHSNCG